MVKIIQPSMAGGEVSPAVSARIDLSKRAVAVQLAENFIPTFTGALRSRPGQQFVARAKPGSDTYRIIEFEFNSTQTFVLGRVELELDDPVGVRSRLEFEF